MQKVQLSGLVPSLAGKDVNLQDITHIIFDLGDVLIPIDRQATFRQFHSYGARNLEHLLDDYLRLEAIRKLETGQLDPAGFCDMLRADMHPDTTDHQICSAWCRMLGEMLPAVLQLLKQLKGTFRLLMLSNTSEVHISFLEEQFRTRFHGLQMSDLFDALYFSHHIGIMKPDPAIYQYVLQEEQIEPGKALFIDDRPENVEGARKLGIPSVCFQPGMSLTDLFTPVS